MTLSITHQATSSLQKINGRSLFFFFLVCGLSQYLIFPTPPGILCHKKPSATQPLLSLTQQRLMLDSKA